MKSAACSRCTAIRKQPILCIWGFMRLQHRGQESAGIAIERWADDLLPLRSMGHVADIFTPDVLNQLPGQLSIGHTRYSTAGDTALRNAQPLSVACSKGQVAVAHNGNLTNAVELRRELEEDGSIFQSTSDTEVVLHLVARSRERTLAGALRDALLQIEGAFSLVFLAEDRIIVARDPHGFRPLAMGRLELPDGQVATVFASETCAFDLINAEYTGDVEPGEMVIVGPRRHDARTLYDARRRRRIACLNMCIFRGRIRLFSASPWRNRAR